MPYEVKALLIGIILLYVLSYLFKIRRAKQLKSTAWIVKGIILRRVPDENIIDQFRGCIIEYRSRYGEMKQIKIPQNLYQYSIGDEVELFEYDNKGVLHAVYIHESNPKLTIALVFIAISVVGLTILL